MLQLLRTDISNTFPSLSIARYSFIQLSELGHLGEKENVQSLKQQQRGFEPRLSRLRVRVPTLGHRAPQALLDGGVKSERGRLFTSVEDRAGATVASRVHLTTTLHHNEVLAMAVSIDVAL